MGKRRVEVVIAGDASSLNRAFGSASKSSSTFAKSLKFAAGYVGITQLSRGFTSVVQQAADFEKKLNVLQATGGATDAQMKLVSATAIRLGSDVKLPGTSAADAASAMLELTKGGLSVQESMDAARGALQLSAAAQIDNATAARIVADSLNAFGLSGKEAVRVADLLAASANATTASMPEMVDALKQSLAVAHQLDIPIGDTVTALGLLANAGIKGSDAGTSLKTMLMRLTAPASDAAKEMKRIGVSSFDAHGKMRPLPAIADDYRKALSGMSDEQKASTLNTIFGSDAVRAAGIVLGRGSSAFEKMSKSVNRQGIAAKIAAAQNEGFEGALDAFTSVVATLAIQLGTTWLPRLARLMTALAGFATWLGVHVPAAWERMKSAGQTAVNWFKSNLLPTISAAVDHIKTVWRFMGDDIMRVAGTVFRVVLSIVRPALQAVVGVFKAIGALIRGDWGALWGSVKQTVSGALRAVVALIRGSAATALAAARFVGTMIWQGVKAGVAKLAQLGGELIRMVGSAIKAAASWALGAAASIGRAIGEGILHGVQSMAGAVASAVQNMASGALDKAKGFLHINSPSKVFSREVGAPITEGIAHGIMSKAPMVSTAIDKLLRKMKGKLSAQSRLSIAELTFGTDDDLAALKRVAKQAEAQLRVALKSGKQDKIQEAAGNLKGVRDQLAQLKGDRRDTKLQAAVDMAKLTAGTDDDVRAMRAMERSLVARLAEATKRKDYAGQSQIAQALLGLRGELAGMNGTNTGGGVNVTINGGQGFDANDPRQLAASISWWMRASAVGAVA